jgi:prophage regulatory protein
MLPHSTASIGGDMNTLIRLSDVMRRTGLGRTSIYQGMASGSFPRSIRLGPRAVAWVEAQIDEWIRSRIRDTVERRHHGVPSS